MAEVIAIHKNDLDKWWPISKPFIGKALSKGYGEMDIDDAYFMIKDQDGILLLILVGDIVATAGIITIVDKPALREMLVLLVGGTQIDEWISDIMKTIDILANETQSDIISVHGRRGWVKKLNEYSYEEAYTTVIKRVT